MVSNESTIPHFTAGRLVGPQARRIGLLSVTLRRLVEAIDFDHMTGDGLDDVAEAVQRARVVLADNRISAEPLDYKTAFARAVSAVELQEARWTETDPEEIVRIVLSAYLGGEPGG